MTDLRHRVEPEPVAIELDRTATLTGGAADRVEAPPSRGETATEAAYEIRSEHARGGLGRVLKAEDRRLGRVVAIKELLRQGNQESRRFLREVQLTARLQHPGIVPIYEAGHWQNGTPFYAMKFIDGQTFKDVLRARATLDERLALLPKLIAVAETMAYAHSERVIHRDLKPANVLIGPFGETVIVDWGLAKELDAPAPSAASAGPYRASAVGSTIEGAVLGTPAYMPPEQARGEEATPRSDVYSLGAIAYELLTGRPPYRGASSAEVLRDVLAGPPPPPAACVAGAPRDLVAIVEKAMARAPERRYADAGELAADLLRFQTGQLVRAHEYSRAALVSRWVVRNRRPVIVAVAALLAMALGGAVGVRRIVRERDRARARGDELILTHAASQLDQDPTAAVAWAKTYPADGADQEQLRALTVDAESRGVARHVFRRSSSLISCAAFSHDGRRLATEEGPATIRISDVASGRVLARLPHGGMSLGIAWTGDDRALLVSNWVRGRPSPLELIDVASGAVTRLGATKTNTSELEVHGDEAVVAGDEGAVELWNLRTRAHRTIARHSRVYAAAFSPDGSQIAAAGSDARITLYDRGSGRLRVFVAAAGVVRLAFTPDGRSLVSGQADGSVTRWDVASGTSHLLGRHDGSVGAVAVSRDGRWVATGSDDRTLRLWNLADGTSRVLAGHAGPIFDIAFSPTAPVVASAGRDTTIRLWHVDSGSVSVLRGHTAAVQQLTFSPDGRYLASAAEDKTTRVWDVGPMTAVQELVGHRDRVVELAVSSDGRLLATADQNETVRVWRLPSGAPVAVHPLPGSATELVFSPDGRRLAAGSRRLVVVWDAHSGAELFRSERSVPSQTWGLRFSPDGRRLAASSADGTVRVWTDGVLQTLPGARGIVRAVAFSPDGSSLAAGGDDQLVRIWNLATGEVRVDRSHHDIVSDVAFSPDGAQLASGSWDDRVVLRDLRGGPVRVWQTPSKVMHVLFSPSGRWLASAGNDGVLTLWDLRNGGWRRLEGHSDTVITLDFSPDERLVASAGWDHTLRLWDTASGAIRGLDRTDGNVYEAHFTVDGARIATANEDGIVRLWPVLSAGHEMLPLREEMEQLTTAVLQGSGRVIETE